MGTGRKEAALLLMRLMFKILILQTYHNLSDAKTEFYVRDRVTWMRFLGFNLGDTMPDENTIRHFRNRLIETVNLACLDGNL